ncbi:MAG: Aminopeptidase YpdF (MP-, MA-, MS-, AP-, NP- specific) [Firmicutes bacterium]|nr:Aminopeptidase YpdF (MP-, MA-, MS-, AP-, NP- specific) [Bacillota bacterium]MDI6706769.1 aminopeptidase P family protein [Bacillota bacterium]
MKLCSKVNEIAERMKKESMDLLFIGTSTDLEYLTGLSSMSCERFKALAILKDGRHFFICPELYYEETREALGDDETIFVWSDSDGFLKAIDEANSLYHLEGMNIGVNDVIRAIDMIAIKGVISANFLDGSGIMENVRQIKDEEEMKLMKKAALIADQVAEEIVRFIRPGLTERDIAKRLKELFIEKGADDISFEPIVASGPNSSKPHYNDDKRTIEERDIIVLDFGCRYKGYCSDMSRTVFVGKPTPEQEEIYNIVLKANSEAEQFARQGVTAEEVDRKARDIIKEAGYGQYFLNRTGHGIGMAVHEAPYIKEGNKVVLENGMAFSVEPGIYLPGRFGMRVENIVLIENGKGIALNKFTKQMICI